MSLAQKEKKNSKSKYYKEDVRTRMVELFDVDTEAVRQSIDSLQQSDFLLQLLDRLFDDFFYTT